MCGRPDTPYLLRLAGGLAEKAVLAYGSYLLPHLNLGLSLAFSGPQFAL